MKQVIYLDIDGVLNDHTPTASGYCTIDARNVAHFNAILDALPNAKIVISSAWRYLMLMEQMTIQGFENMLLSFGICCRDRLIGFTPKDGDCRAALITKHAKENGYENYVVLDDMDLPHPQLIRTEPKVGLTDRHVNIVVGALILGDKEKKL